MIIKKYKRLKSGKYEIVFDNDTKEELYEDVILKYELLLNPNITNKKLDELLDYNKECDAYYIALKAMNTKFRSEKELSDYLNKKELPLNLIQKALNKLKSQGYIDDKAYASSYLNQQLLTTSRGPNKIRYDLSNKGISNEIIIEIMKLYTKEHEEEKITKIITRMIKSNRSRSSIMLKNKIYKDLITQGFSKDIITKAIEQYGFIDDNKLYDKEYQKLYKKLSTKYSGYELEYMIKQKLYQKGFRGE